MFEFLFTTLKIMVMEYGSAKNVLNDRRSPTGHRNQTTWTQSVMVDWFIMEGGLTITCFTVICDLLLAWTKNNKSRITYPKVHKYIQCIAFYRSSWMDHLQVPWLWWQHHQRSSGELHRRLHVWVLQLTQLCWLCVHRGMVL